MTDWFGSTIEFFIRYVSLDPCDNDSRHMHRGMKGKEQVYLVGAYFW